MRLGENSLKMKIHDSGQSCQAIYQVFATHAKLQAIQSAGSWAEDFKVLSFMDITAILVMLSKLIYLIHRILKMAFDGQRAPTYILDRQWTSGKLVYHIF